MTRILIMLLFGAVAASCLKTSFDPKRTLLCRLLLADIKMKLCSLFVTFLKHQVLKTHFVVE